jgi:hypothetical protein
MHNGKKKILISKQRKWMKQSIANKNTESKEATKKHTLCQKQRSLCDMQMYKKKVFHQCWYFWL